MFFGQIQKLIELQKIMLDRDLAELYGVETRVLNHAVTRNADRFPNDFMIAKNIEVEGRHVNQYR
jgi:hypothetical protein